MRGLDAPEAVLVPGAQGGRRVGHALEQEKPRSAEGENAPSTHAMRMQNGKLCMQMTKLMGATAIAVIVRRSGSKRE